MWYWIVAALLAVWVLVDGWRRAGPVAIAWALGAFVLTPFVVPVYFAVRPLKAGETREGGRAWNILKNFALTWTVLTLAIAVVGLQGIGDMPAATSDAETVGRGVGTALGLGAIAMLWFFPMVGAVLLGFFLRKTSVVERGPTGRLALAGASPASAPAVPAATAVPDGGGGGESNRAASADPTHLSV